MGRYAEWNDVVEVYPQVGRGKGADEVNSIHLYYAENQLDGLLASHFTVPFSNNNVTVKELAIDLTAIRLGRFKDKDAETAKKDLFERIERLKNGEEAMLVSIGGTLVAMYRTETAWSSTQDYTPTFGVGDSPEFIVSSAQRLDEENNRA